jgi:hypothetical protein
VIEILEFNDGKITKTNNIIYPEINEDKLGWDQLHVSKIRNDLDNAYRITYSSKQNNGRQMINEAHVWRENSSRGSHIFHLKNMYEAPNANSKFSNDGSLVFSGESFRMYKKLGPQ